MSTLPKPPAARRVPRRLEKHGHVRTDDYYWLKERESEEVLSHLREENAYFESMLAHTAELRESLYQEIVARIPQSDESVPFLLDGYYYSLRYEPGKEYAIYSRRKGSLEAPEELLLDANELARGHEFFSLSGLAVSYGRNILSFATDTVGRRIYTLRFRHLDTGDFLPDVIPDVTGNVAWATDNRTILYTRMHPETLRWHRVYRHELGTDPAGDELVYEEKDETFNVQVGRTKSRRYLTIVSSHTIADEVRILESDNPRGSFRLFEPRLRGREYSVDHFEDHFYIRTNDGAKNFRLMKTPVGATGREHWVEALPYHPEIFLMDFEVFRSHLVVSERKRGLARLRVIPWTGEGEHSIEFDEPAYAAGTGENPEMDTPVLRFVYSSLTTPWTTWDYDMNTRQRILRKRDRVGGGFDSANYVTERAEVPARDGKRVPISLVYRKGFRRDGTAPLLLYAYGSYGISTEASFRSEIVSLLDRGFVFGIAHIRGGEELGRDWYDDGKLLRKKNTFTDFIDAAEFLRAEKYANPSRLFAMGGSAGGLLVATVMNLRPDLFRGVVARVPFVDVITSMLEPDLPLTTSEYDEWGDPNVREFYDYMLSYSPYDQVEPRAYPNLLVTTGLHDSQVQYWEPAKWVAKLRTVNTANSVILMKTHLEAGHGGASGRFKRHHETAEIYAFLLDLAGRG